MPRTLNVLFIQILSTWWKVFPVFILGSVGPTAGLMGWEGWDTGGFSVLASTPQDWPSGLAPLSIDAIKEGHLEVFPVLTVT